jgi:hypothetical protein
VYPTAYENCLQKKIRDLLPGCSQSPIVLKIRPTRPVVPKKNKMFHQLNLRKTLYDELHSFLCFRLEMQSDEVAS